MDIYSSGVTPQGGQDCVRALAAVSSPSHSGKKLVNKKVEVIARSKGCRRRGFLCIFSQVEQELKSHTSAERGLAQSQSTQWTGCRGRVSTRNLMIKSDA